MRISLTQVGLLVSILNFASSLVVSDSPIAEACTAWSRTLNWECDHAASHMNTNIYKCQCSNQNWLGSVTNCIHMYSNSTAQAEHGYRHIISRCNPKAGTNYTFDEMKNYQLNAVSSVRFATASDKKNPVEAHVIPDVVSFRPWYLSYKQWADSIYLSMRLGWGCLGFWISMVGLSTFYYIFDLKRFIPGSINRPFYRLLLLPIVPFLGLTLWEFFVCFWFCITVLLSCIINYHTPVNLYLTTNYFRMMELISFRTDLIGFSLFPALYLMGIRNNPFQFISGYSHAMMIRYHKIVAWVIFIMAIIHSVIWTAYPIHAGGGYSAWAQDWYFIWGIVGSVILGLMIFLAWKPFRDLMYETFLILHQAFSIVFIIAMWYHCNTLGWMGWVYSMAAILSFDRFCRIIRVTLNGLFRSAKVEIVGSKIIKLTMDKPKYFYLYPGSYVYIHFMQPFYYAWQSHPFSLINSTESDDKLVVYLRVKKGITRSVEKIKNGSVKVLIDGPYGNFPIVSDNKFGKIIGIAGGVGLTSIITFFNKIEDLSKHKLIWVVHDVEEFHSFSANLEYLSSHSLHLDVYLTSSGQSENEIETETDYSNNEKDILSFSGSSSSLKNNKEFINYTIHHGRPNFQTILDAEFQDTKSGKIYVCGPRSMLKATSKATSQCIKNGLNIEYSDENHEW